MNSHQKTTKFTCRNPTSSFSNEGIISNLTLKDLLLSILPPPIREHGATIVCRNYSHVPYTTPSHQFLKAALSSQLLGKSAGACCIRSSDFGPFPLSFPAVKVLPDSCGWCLLLLPEFFLGLSTWSVEEGGNRPLHHPSSIDPQGGGRSYCLSTHPNNPSSLGGQPVPGYCAKKDGEEEKKKWSSFGGTGDVRRFDDELLFRTCLQV
ncbi:hypothetical protein NPIL_140701 [Nephila pilipes]|uniref:Uncharacterized protein n=1 Tax=Nephila pilipes TaxID=299642 RepID=A0A8X6MZW5_NEPPI|nr:hypothetical protein NPIL_140701 [Nephila pilipes]